MAFRDILNIEVAAGNGGDGSMSFHRAKYMEKGGPDGGHGGKGGDIILRAIEGVESLERLLGRRKFKAQNGAYGEGRLRQGSDGDVISPLSMFGRMSLRGPCDSVVSCQKLKNKIRSAPLPCARRKIDCCVEAPCRTLAWSRSQSASSYSRTKLVDPCSPIPCSTLT